MAAPAAAAAAPPLAALLRQVSVDARAGRISKEEKQAIKEKLLADTRTQSAAVAAAVPASASITAIAPLPLLKLFRQLSSCEKNGTINPQVKNEFKDLLLSGLETRARAAHEQKLAEKKKQKRRKKPSSAHPPHAQPEPQFTRRALLEVEKAMHQAVEECSTAEFLKNARILVQNNAPLNEPNEKSVKTLMLAAQNGHVEAIDFLLANGIDVSKDQRELFESVKFGHADCLEKLVRARSAKVDSVDPFQKRSLLYMAVSMNMTPVVKALLAARASPASGLYGARGTVIKAPLSLAIDRDFHGTALELAKAGCSVFAASEFGKDHNSLHSWERPEMELKRVVHKEWFDVIAHLALNNYERVPENQLENLLNLATAHSVVKSDFVLFHMSLDFGFSTGSIVKDILDRYDYVPMYVLQSLREAMREGRRRVRAAMYKALLPYNCADVINIICQYRITEVDVDLLQATVMEFKERMDAIERKHALDVAIDRKAHQAHQRALEREEQKRHNQRRRDLALGDAALVGFASLFEEAEDPYEEEAQHIPAEVERHNQPQIVGYDVPQGPHPPGGALPEWDSEFMKEFMQTHHS